MADDAQIIPGYVDHRGAPFQIQKVPADPHLAQIAAVVNEFTHDFSKRLPRLHDEERLL
jgi:hypothetical protein